MSAVSVKSPEPSMDEILASIRRIIADDGDGVPVAASPSGHAPASPEDHPRADPVDNPREQQPADLPELDFSEADPIAPPLPALVVPAETVEPKIADEHRTAIETLVSNEATQTIGHAFNALSHTILAQNARTLEDLVKDLLRPMLKVWLDDNLPPLVERLVRTEIERVARGHR